MEFTFDDFRARAKDERLSKWEKVGFPDSYRKGKDIFIFNDIVEKLQLRRNNLMLLDIGSGCSELVELLIQHARASHSQLVLVDSAEMLQSIAPEKLHSGVTLVPGYFPAIENFKESYSGKMDAVLVYSVLQYVFLEQNIFGFLHACVELLKPNGRLLLGDIPNFSARERFLLSTAGEEFRKNAADIPAHLSVVHENQERMDDSIVFAILSRFRSFGCETYLLPQAEQLPFAGRREDILIIKR